MSRLLYSSAVTVYRYCLDYKVPHKSRRFSCSWNIPGTQNLALLASDAKTRDYSMKTAVVSPYARRHERTSFVYDTLQ